MTRLRPYQTRAVELIYSYFTHNTGNPVLEAPTAAGKSVIQASFVQGVLDTWPDQRILCLCHVKELVEQNYQKMRLAWPRGSIGINAASLKRRDTRESVIFASIQSVYKIAHELGRFDLIMIDECHLVPTDGAGMYRKFIDDCRKYNPKIKVIGFSATPYRMNNGLLIEGEDRIFTDLIPAKAAGMSIDDLLAQGYLSPLTTAPVRTALDISAVPIRGGEYVAKDLAAAVDVDSVTQRACDEIVAHGRDRDAWLIFASSIEHAHHIAAYLNDLWINTKVVTGETPEAERAAIISAYRMGSIKALVNVNVLTTGFDAPHTDLLACLRPTMSTSLYVQMMGRGMRVHPGKSDCLVLDFANLIATHGPVNNVTPPRRKIKGEERMAPIKECGKCLMLIHASARSCMYCGEQFQFDTTPNIVGKASTLDVLASNAPVKVEPSEMAFSVHRKAGKPDSLRVDYYSGPLRVATEWVCLFHDGIAQARARQWWQQHVGTAMVSNIEEAVEVAQIQAQLPTYLYIQNEGKYERIVSRGFSHAA